jgi:hypothetical protein
MPAKLSTASPKAHRARKLSLSLPTQRNVRQAILSDLRVEAWYPSFYPVELIGKACDQLYICKWCFKYTVEGPAFTDHTTVNIFSFILDYLLILTRNFAL